MSDLVQTVVGVGVGVAVSALILPPLNLNDAVGQMSRLRRTAARQLQEMGEALETDWAADDPRWSERRDDLMASARNARDDLQYADESRKGNVRRRFHPRDVHLARGEDRVTGDAGLAAGADARQREQGEELRHPDLPFAGEVRQQ